MYYGKILACSKCKNTSHRLGNNDILVNLDCDNFTGPNGGLFILTQFEKLPRKTLIHQGQNIYMKVILVGYVITKKIF